MIKKFSEEASINNFGSVQYDRSQKYMTQKDKDQACENIGLGSSIARNLEEVVFANIPIDSSTLRFSFGDLNYDPTKDTDVASAHNQTDRPGGGTAAGYGGTWKKLNTYYTNIWDYTYSDDTLLREFDNGNFSAGTMTATRFWNDVEKNPIKIIASDTADCTNFKGAFQGIWALTEVWELDTSSATNVSFLFQYCKNLVRVPRVLDFSSIVTAGNSGVSVFSWCSNLEEINQIIFPDDDTLSVDIQIFAKGCVSLKSINEPINCKSLVNFSNSFAGCVSLGHLVLQNTGRVTNWASTFSACKNLPLSFFNTLDTSAGTNLSGILWGYAGQSSGGSYIWDIEVQMDNITELPTFDYSSATAITAAFRLCNIKYIDSDKLATVKSSAKVGELFQGNKNVEAGMIAAYNVLKAKSPTNTANCFTDCGINTEAGSTERKYIPTSWGGDME